VTRTQHAAAVLPAFLAAAALPIGAAFSQPPSPTVYNQLLAFGLWGLVAALLAGRHRPGAARRARVLLAGLALCGIAATASGLGGLPAGLALSAMGFIGAAVVLVLSGASAVNREAAALAFYTAWLIAALCSAFVGLGQVFMPQAIDGDWIALSSSAGRAVGNLRQPNHLATVLLWGGLAIVPLHASGRLRTAVAIPVYALLVFGIVLSASRTGFVGVMLLACWGLLDRRLPRGARGLLLAAPLIYAAGWALMTGWSQVSGQPFEGAVRLASTGLTGGTRSLVWSDTLALIAAQPMSGVGWGRYNLAWSLTPFMPRSGEFFDHSHNLPLQLLAELGVPLGAAVTGLLLWALGQSWRRSGAANGTAAYVDARTAFMMVLLVSLHSLLEYPLWYGYFLLPTAWAWGFALGSQSGAAVEAGPSPLRWAGLALAAAALFALLDYQRVVAVYAAAPQDPPLAERVAAGQRSLLFPHHADYAAATMAEHPGQQMAALQRASHYLLDTRLMTAWAVAYAEQGDLDRARHLAERLREFNNPASAEFFAPCKQPAASAPFQCAPPTRTLSWRDFVVR
jgi:O-antigen ligase